jgi:cytosine/adenosine deaminase-related metal-dependent hydrolase
VRCVLGRICNDDGSRHAAVLAEAERFLGGSTALLHPSLAVSIPEVATDAMLHAASRLCAEAGAVFQVHVNEHLASVERSLVARGLRPLQHLDAAGALGPQALLAHCTMLVPDEMLLLRDSGCAGRDQSGREPVERQRGGADRPAGGLEGPPRPRHRRHAQRRDSG